VLSCSSRLRREERIELFEKLGGEVLNHRQRLGLRDMEERVCRRVILQGRWVRTTSAFTLLFGVLVDL